MKKDIFEKCQDILRYGEILHIIEKESKYGYETEKIIFYEHNLYVIRMINGLYVSVKKYKNG